ncbi:MAG TPA: response regulator, partial [Vicinamibacterales bacterium]|nr:response regulator [Vicinamibacterales bacterium]
MPDSSPLPLRIAVVDDEPLARAVLCEFLAAEPNVEVVAQCANGFEAVKAVSELSPDLLLLDVQMPKLDGFEVLDLVGKDVAVVFTTAYDQYALRAFEVHALDYLLKPFESGRFYSTLERARDLIERQRAGDLGRKLLAMVQDLRPEGSPPADRLVVKSAGRIFFVRLDEIDWIDAAGNYVRLHVNGETHLFRETMNAIEKRL